MGGGAIVHPYETSITCVRPRNHDNMNSSMTNRILRAFIVSAAVTFICISTSNSTK